MPNFRLTCHKDLLLGPISQPKRAPVLLAHAILSSARQAGAWTWRKSPLFCQLLQGRSTIVSVKAEQSEPYTSLHPWQQRHTDIQRHRLRLVSFCLPCPKRSLAVVPALPDELSKRKTKRSMVPRINSLAWGHTATIAGPMCQQHELQVWPHLTTSNRMLPWPPCCWIRGALQGAGNQNACDTKGPHYEGWECCIQSPEYIDAFRAINLAVYPAISLPIQVSSLYPRLFCIQC